MAKDSGAEWNEWWRSHHFRVIRTRRWKDEKRFYDSGLRDMTALIDRFRIPATGACHEIGCGPGRMTVHLQDRYTFLSANEVASEILAACRQAVRSDVLLRLGGADALDGLEQDRYDVVLAVAVMQHVQTVDEATDYVIGSSRLLAPGGVAYLQVAKESRLRRVHDFAVDLGRGSWSRVFTPRRLAPRGPSWRGCRPDLAEARRMTKPDRTITLVQESNWRARLLTEWVVVARSAEEN